MHCVGYSSCALGCMRSNLRECKIQNFPKGMPKTPIDAVCLNTRVYNMPPPYSLIKPYYTPPLNHFLDEGLLGISKYFIDVKISSLHAHISYSNADKMYAYVTGLACCIYITCNVVPVVPFSIFTI